MDRKSERSPEEIIKYEYGGGILMTEEQILDVINVDFTRIDQFEDEAKWLELRTTGIGGSDAGAIMGMNKYASPLTVYMQKKGVEGFKGNNSTKWGHILENPIREKAREELGIDIAPVPGMFTSIEYPFMNANLDGLCHAEHQVTIGGETVEGFGGHEIKTSTQGAGFGIDEIPDSYYCQVQHYMAVTGLNWFILTVFFLNTKEGRHYVIRRNNDFIYDRLIPAERDFWNNYVLADVVPEPLGLESEDEYLANLPVDENIALDDEADILLETIDNLSKKIKELESQKSINKDKLILKLHELSSGSLEADKVMAKGEKFKLSYNLQVRKSIDSEQLKKDGLYDSYTKTSSSRVMRISEVK